MTLDSSALVTIIQPGLQNIQWTVTTSPITWTTDIFPPRWDPAWLKSYKRFRALALRERNGGGPAEARQARTRQLTRLEQSQRAKRDMMERSLACGT